MSAVVGYAGRRLTAAGHTGTAYLLVPLGWVVQEWARGATPYGGFPWARLAFSQADSPLAHVARWLGAPGVTFAVAVVGTLLLAAVTSVVQPLLRPCRGLRRRGRRLVALVPLAIALPTDGRRGVGRLRPGQRAAGRAGLQRRATGRARQPRERHRAARRDQAPTTSPSSCGRRTPPTSTRSATPTPPPRSTSPRGGRGAAAHRGRARRAARLQLERLALLPAGGRRARALRQAAPGPVRRVHPGPGVLPDLHADGRPRRQLRRRRPDRGLPGPAPGGDSSPSPRSASRWPTTT